MKIRIETTLVLDEHDIACVKAQMKDHNVTDETLRDYVKSSAASYAGYFVQQAVSNFGEYVQED